MPVITISRMYGSGGSEVAERVADALGWQLFDNALLDAVAQRCGLTASEATAQDERVPSIVERLATALALGSPEILPPLGMESTEERMVSMTKLVIDEALQTGPAVFVGRGAQALLAERTDALHVFCYGPKKALCKYAEVNLGIPPRDAERVVTETNRQREQYVKRHWQRNWLAHENYHLCLNTAWLGLDDAAALVVETARKHLEGNGTDPNAGRFY